LQRNEEKDILKINFLKYLFKTVNKYHLIVIIFYYDKNKVWKKNLNSSIIIIVNLIIYSKIKKIIIYNITNNVRI